MGSQNNSLPSAILSAVSGLSGGAFTDCGRAEIVGRSRKGDRFAGPGCAWPKPAAREPASGPKERRFASSWSANATVALPSPQAGSSCERAQTTVTAAQPVGAIGDDRVHAEALEAAHRARIVHRPDADLQTERVGFFDACARRLRAGGEPAIAPCPRDRLRDRAFEFGRDESRPPRRDPRAARAAWW